MKLFISINYRTQLDNDGGHVTRKNVALPITLAPM